jgi:hypothetical protein
VSPLEPLKGFQHPRFGFGRFLQMKVLLSARNPKLKA